ncbi:type VI secretion system baseplate subunit TssG [Erwinia amylovora]
MMDKQHDMLSNWLNVDEPWRAGFISIMRAISARYPSIPQPGTAQLPADEPFILGQSAHVSFAPREIAKIDSIEDKLKIQLFSLGVWGPQGAMPVHNSELAYSRAESHDNNLTDFLDIFHHRALSLFFRAWFVSQDSASLDRVDDERFSFYLGSLIGLAPDELKNTDLPVHARLAASAHLIRESRNPEGLSGALHYYYSIPVKIEEFTRHWISLDHNDQSVLGNNDAALLMGEGAILGNTILDRQHKFKVILGPLTMAQYMSFSVWGNNLPSLKEWVRSFVGYEYAWDVELILAASEIPMANLDGSHQLGYATWLISEKNDHDITGMCFEPETYVC